MVFKCQQLEDNESDITELKVSKRPHVDAHEYEERQSSEKYQGKGCKYISLFSYSQKESIRLTDLREQIKS